MATPRTPNSEAAAELERVLADKEALLSQLREQADALETQIKMDQDRLTTARSGRRPRTALLGAESFTPREQIARSQMSGASTARPATAASQSLAPLVEGNVEQMSFERPMTGLSASLRPSTSRSERASIIAMHTDRPATSAGGKTGATRMVSATMGTWVRMTQMHEFSKENRRKLQNMFVLADPHGSMKLSVEALYSVYYKAGFDVSFEEFLKILEAMGESGQDALDYADFFSHIATLTFEMPEVFEAQTSVEFAPTHIMRILSRRLTERYSAIMRQFKLEDTEGNGELTRQQLLRVIRATGLQFSETQLDELLRNIDLLPLSTLNANKFINIFVPHHPIPSERVDLGTSIRMPNAPKQMSEAPLMTTAQLKAALQEKLRLSIDSPKEMFFQMDQSKDGTLTRHDFFRAFQRFGLFPTEKQVDELFRELDVDRKGRLDYQQFLARMAPKSHAHPHTAPPTFSATADMDAYASAREKVRTATASGPRMPGATASQMQQAVQSKLGSLASWERALAFFRAQDVGLMGKVGKEQVLQVLRKFDIFMNVAQFDDVMVAMKLPRTGQIDYVEFLQNFAKNSAGAHGQGEQTGGEKKTVATPVHSPRNLNMLQARAERARQSLERVTKSPQASVQAIEAAQTRTEKDQETRRKLLFASRLAASPRTPRTPILGAVAGGPRTRVVTPRDSRLGEGELDEGGASEKQSFDRIKGSLARQWEAFQAAFFLLQDEDAYFKVGKVGLKRLLHKFSIECSPAELSMLWRKLTPVARVTLPEGKGGGIDYFDLIRVFGPNHNKPSFGKMPGPQGSGLKALIANASKPFEGHITGNWNLSLTDRFDPNTGNHQGKYGGSKIHTVLSSKARVQ